MVMRSRLRASSIIGVRARLNSSGVTGLAARSATIALMVEKNTSAFSGLSSMFAAIRPYVSNTVDCAVLTPGE